MKSSAVSVKNISTKYGIHQILEGINFQIEENDFLAIIGPNGAGKSTLLKILIGLESPRSGCINIFGNPVKKINSSLIGYVPQIKTMDRSFPALAIELVMSGFSGRWPWSRPQVLQEKALNSLQRVGAEKLAWHSISILSGGELQRVLLARSFVREPKIVVLDEPATGIDVVGEADLYRHLETYQRETRATIIMVTHDWQVVTNHSTKVLLLNIKQVGFGSPSQVLTEEKLKTAFGHTGHEHPEKFILKSNG